MNIKWTRIFFLVTALVACLGFSRAASAAIKIAGCGDSITAQVPGWTGDLQTLLGTSYAVQNDGVSGATLLNNGNNPYTKTTKFTASENFAPDIVIIMLGTNDSKPANWTTHKAEFEADYKALIATYQALPSHPRVFLNICPPAGVNSFAIDGTVIENEVVPLIKKVAADTCVGLIDVFSAMGGHTLNTSYFSATDQVHPNAAGAQKIADTVYAALQADRADAGTCVPVAADAGPLDASARPRRTRRPPPRSRNRKTRLDRPARQDRRGPVERRPRADRAVRRVRVGPRPKTRAAAAAASRRARTVSGRQCFCRSSRSRGARARGSTSPAGTRRSTLLNSDHSRRPSKANKPMDSRAASVRNAPCIVSGPLAVAGSAMARSHECPGETEISKCNTAKRSVGSTNTVDGGRCARPPRPVWWWSLRSDPLKFRRLQSAFRARASMLPSSMRWTG
jgi:lysophospholipase L1-like esterase